MLEFLETGNSLISITPPELLADASASEDGAYKFVAAFRYYIYVLGTASVEP